MNEPPASIPDAGPAAPPPGPISLRLPTTTPSLTFGIMGITILVYIVQLLTPNYYYTLDLPTFLGSKINAAIRAGELWRLITPVLIHGSLLHIGFNMYALFAFGPGLARRVGHFRFLVLYLLGGFAGNVLSFLLSSGISVGASTAIFGLIAAEGIFLYQNRKLLGNIQGEIGNVITIILINLFLGFSSGGRIDNWGHIGGLFGGLIFAWFGGPLWEVEGVYPLMQLVDRRDFAHVAIGIAVVVFLFGGLALWGMFHPIVQ